MLPIGGWVLYIGQTIFVQAVFGAASLYIVDGPAHPAARLPLLGPRLPLRLSLPMPGCSSARSR